jgi:hypothetical protein
MASSSQRLATLFMALLVAGLVALNWQLAQAPIDVTAIAPPLDTGSEPASVTPPDSTLPRLQSVSELPETLARPLFQPDRRPLEAKAKSIAEPQPEPAPSIQAAPEPPPPSADGFRLVGMMRMGEKDKRVLIRSPSSAQAKWLAAGAEIDGWRVDLIGKDRVLLTKDRGEAELLLHAAPAEKAGTEPSTPPR